MSFSYWCGSSTTPCEYFVGNYLMYKTTRNPNLRTKVVLGINLHSAEEREIMLGAADCTPSSAQCLVPVWPNWLHWALQQPSRDKLKSPESQRAKEHSSLGSIYTNYTLFASLTPLLQKMTEFSKYGLRELVFRGTAQTKDREMFLGQGS